MFDVVGVFYKRYCKFVVQQWAVVQAKHRAASSAAKVLGSKNHAADTSVNNGTGAHWARLQSYVQGGVWQAIVLAVASGLTQDFNLCVGTGVVSANWSIMSTCQQLTGLVYENCPDGDFGQFFGFFSLGDCYGEPLFVICGIYLVYCHAINDTLWALVLLPYVMNTAIHALLPKKLLSAGMYRLARIRQPLVKKLAIRIFMAATTANLNDAARKSLSDYDSLLDFFTRELSTGARPIEAKDNDHVIVCPVDGRVAHVGNIIDAQIFQIKGHTYALDELVGQDYAAAYRDGQAATIYLAPHDYHRIHMPMSGQLLRARYLPGELNSVSISLLDKIAGLFAKNERVVLEFDSDGGQPFLMVLVGAVNVGSIETVFHGEICPNQYHATIDLECDLQHLAKGDELGRFNLGSTIIFITQANHHAWQLHDKQKTKMGQTIATLKTTTTKTAKQDT